MSFEEPPEPNDPPSDRDSVIHQVKIDPDSQLRGGLRLFNLVIGLLGIGLLFTANRLSPDGNGYGTHRQLGFPQCTVIEVFGIPCPSCGMTTSWSYLTRGNLFAAFRVNPGGALLGILAMIISPWMFVSGILGRWWAAKPDLVLLFILLLSILLVTVVHWIIRISFFSL